MVSQTPEREVLVGDSARTLLRARLTLRLGSAPPSERKKWTEDISMAVCLPGSSPLVTRV